MNLLYVEMRSHIETQKEPKHGVDTHEFPYQKTWALPLAEVHRLPRQAPYVHPKGAIGVVRFRKPWCERPLVAAADVLGTASTAAQVHTVQQQNSTVS